MFSRALSHCYCRETIEHPMLELSAWFILGPGTSSGPEDWLPDLCRDRLFRCEVTPGDRFEVSFRCGHRSGRIDVRTLADHIGDDGCPVYFDLTRLPIQIWAPLLKRLQEDKRRTWAIYEEPEDYRRHPSPDGTSVFQLSRAVSGVAPIPGFVRLSSRQADGGILVALLGFEGPRSQQILATVDPPATAVPIIGCPGYRPEYVQRVAEANSSFLSSTDSYGRIHLAAALEPTDVERVLQRISREYPTSRLMICLTGSRPHVLGAVLFALRDARVELLYDYPEEFPTARGRTRRFHVYTVVE